VPDDPWSPHAWRSQAFDGFRDLLAPFGEHLTWPTLADLEREWLVRHEVTAASNVALRLIRQKEKSRRARPRNRGDLYDVSVYNGQLPTRANNWHDFFNVLVFAAFAHSKRALHVRHCRILEERVPAQIQTLPGTRTREQDHLAMLDEGGVLLAVDSADAESLVQWLDTAQHERLRTAVDRGKIRAWLIGHAHLEHLAINSISTNSAPLPRAKPVVLDVGVGACRAQVDDALATRLAAPSVEFLQTGWRAVPLDCLYCDLSRQS